MDLKLMKSKLQLIEKEMKRWPMPRFITASFSPPPNETNPRLLHFLCPLYTSILYHVCVTEK